MLHRIGGHFPGSAVAHFVGADGRGVPPSGDTVACTPDEHWVSFMRSHPTRFRCRLLSPAKVADRAPQLDFDRLYDNFAGQVIGDAADWVRRSADRYIAVGPRGLRPPHRVIRGFSTRKLSADCTGTAPSDPLRGLCPIARGGVQKLCGVDHAGRSRAHRPSGGSAATRAVHRTRARR